MHTTQQHMLRNLTWLGVSSLLVKPLWFVFITAYAVRFLGPREYGSFTAAMALGGIVVGLCVAGTAAITTREVARRQEYAPVYWATLLPFRTGLALLALFILEGLASWMGLAPTLLRAAWLYWFAQSLLDFLRSFIRASEKMRYEAETVVMEKAAAVAGGAGALLLHASPVALLLGMAAGTFATAAVATWRVHTHVAPLRWGAFDYSMLGPTLKAALPLGLSAIFIAIYIRIDVVMVERMIGPTEAGLYGVAYRFLEALSQLPELLMIVLLPRLSILHGQGDRQTSTRLTHLSVLSLLGISAAIAALLTVGAEWILRLLMPEVIAAASLLQVLVWVFPFAAVNYVLSTSLVARDDQLALMWLLGVAAVVNVGINVLMIPRYGAMGAAVATLITEGMLLLLLGLRYARANPRPAVLLSPLA